MKKLTVPIRGMHCRSCELLISDELMQVKHVIEVKVRHAKGEAEIFHTKKVDLASVRQAVINAGYTIGKEPPKPWFSRNPDDYFQVGLSAFILFVLFLTAKETGLLRITDSSSNNLSSLQVIFVLGLTAGFSTCAALVGGLVLAASARFAEKNPNATAMQKFIPHIYFNIGRILSFLVFGALIGWIGSLFQMSLGLMGLFTMVVGGVMLIFGAQLTGLFPKLSGINFTIPPIIAQKIGLAEKTNTEYSHKNSMILGALTFILPCGFTQLVQLYAISTANPVTAALTMGIFALGTTPGLLGIGGLTAFVKGSFAKPFFKFAGILVIALAVFNISNGLNLSGLMNGIVLSANSERPVKTGGPVQILKTVYKLRSDIQPNTFTVKAGRPVRMEIDVEESGFGCMGSFALPGLSRQVEMLVKGKNMVFEFTPDKPGTYQITCAMGVPRGTITVI